MIIARLAVPHFHWLISAPSLAVSSITASLCASIEFALIPTGARYASGTNPLRTVRIARVSGTDFSLGNGRPICLEKIPRDRLGGQIGNQTDATVRRGSVDSEPTEPSGLPVFRRQSKFRVAEPLARAGGVSLDAEDEFLSENS